jgi:hypothetical protein
MQLAKLKTIPPGKSIPINTLGKPRLLELQGALTWLGYPVGDLDGLYGPKTRNGWGEAVADFALGSADSIDAADVAKLQKALDKTKSARAFDLSTRKGTIAAIKSECTRQGLGLKTQIAYVLATAEWETNHTFKPVREAYWIDDCDNYLKTHSPSSKYYPFYGRGFVQLTWQKNYETYGRLLSLDLGRKPDLALDPKVALFVLVHGFKTGGFTGRKLSDFVNAQETDFLNARRCINGVDRQKEIADLAKEHLARI